MTVLRHVMLIILVLLCVVSVKSSPQVPGFFIFGDSLVDNGNNNRILTLARANYFPYGIDFQEGISGRFTNGRTTVDILAQLLGFSDYIPPYATAQGPMLLKGVNYASGAAGIRNETGNNLGQHLSMDQQVANFASTVQEMRRMFKGNTTRLQSYLSKCIFNLVMGSNDYLNNYFMPDYYTTGMEYRPGTYAALLLQDYEHQLTQLYNLGARKIAVNAIGQIGCIPYEIARLNANGNGSRCNEMINKAVVRFNRGLQKMVARLNNGQLPGAKFVYVNNYHISRGLVVHAASYGFEVIDTGCCGVGRNNGQITCLPLQLPCNDRSKYLFWDSFHLTEAANVILAYKAYSSKLGSDVYPMNIRQLAMI